MDVSVIIPVYNEEASVVELFEKIKGVLSRATAKYEVVFVDDGSTDQTLAKLIKLRDHDEHVKVHSFTKNFGKSAALMAGFRAAKGEVLITMDGDLQDDPKEVPRFMKMINKGFDMVTGWKHVRHDPVSKTLPSKFFNWLTAKVTGANVHDSNCGYKAYRKEVAKKLELYTGFHRYIPAIVNWHGGKITEIKVTHHPRTHGKSKYGPGRLIAGTIDLLMLRRLYSGTKKKHGRLGYLGSIVLIIGVLYALYHELNKSSVIFFRQGYWYLVISSMIVMIGISMIILELYVNRSMQKKIDAPKYVLKKL